MFIGRERNSRGQFSRTRTVWKPSQWDNGYIDHNGRMNVYRPDYPRSWSNGYAFRAHVVWWLETGTPAPETHCVHHKDHNRLNDYFDNLEIMEYYKHSTLHNANRKTDVECQCTQCGIIFQRKKWRITTRNSRNLFCSHKCFLASPRPKRVKRIKLRCGSCNKLFQVTPFFAKHRKFCSNRCSGMAKRDKPRPRTRHSSSTMPPP